MTLIRNCLYLGAALLLLGGLAPLLFACGNLVVGPIMVNWWEMGHPYSKIPPLHEPDPESYKNSVWYQNHPEQQHKLDKAFAAAREFQ